MPELNRLYSLRITPEQFLEACSPTELQEVELLLNSQRIRTRMNDQVKLDKPIDFRKWQQDHDQEL